MSNTNNSNSNNNSSSNTGIPLLTAPFLHYIPTSPPSQELDFHLPSRPPLHGLTVSDWTGIKPKRATSNVKESTDDNWKDVYRNIKCMDQLYDASFYSWLKSEENVLVTSMYLHRIANEYPLVRIINALKWLISDWRLESISTLVRHVTVDWCDEVGDLRRAHLLRHLTHSWATQYTTTLITMVLSSAPYTTTSSYQRERFLRAFTKEWDFSKLSEFFMYLQSPANIDYKVKCVMLQEAARRERETLGAKLKKKRVSDRKEDMDVFQTDNNNTNTVSSSVTPIGSTTVSVSTTDGNNNNNNHGNHNHSNNNNASATCGSLATNTSCFISDTPTLSSNSAATTTTTASGSSSSSAAAAAAVVVVSAAGPNNSEMSSRRHHRRTSSNDVNDIKRLRLSTPDLDHSDNQDAASVVNYTTNSGTSLNAPNSGNANTTTRRSASPDHHSHSHSHSSLHHLRCVTCTPPASSTSTATNGIATAATTSSNTPLFTAGSATSHSGLSNNAPTSSTTGTTNTPQVDVFSTCYPYNSNSSLQVHGIHLRRRSSSSASTDSNTNEVEDPMDTDTNVKKRTGSSVTIAHFTDETS